MLVDDWTFAVRIRPVDLRGTDDATTADLLVADQSAARCQSAACYGASHASAWIDAGFAAASGAVGVATDSAASFPTFLNSWRSGLSFADAVDRANRADSIHAYDTWAKLNPTWRDANSTRQVKVAPGVSNQGISFFRATRQDRFCAEEGQQCVIPPGNLARRVFYGAMGQYVDRSEPPGGLSSAAIAISAVIPLKACSRPAGSGETALGAIVKPVLTGAPLREPVLAAGASGCHLRTNSGKAVGLW